MRTVLRLILLAAFASTIAVAGPSRAGRIRIGVFTLFHPTELTLATAPGNALRISAGESSLTLLDGQFARCRLAGAEVNCRSGERILRGRVVRATGRGGMDANFVLGVPGKITRNYRGAFSMFAVDKELVPIVEMNLETAVASAVAAESPYGAPLEALKAQAVVTRSYYLAAPHRHPGFDFCDTTHCQFLRESPAPGFPASIAAAETRGIVLLYQGSVLPALFSASCGGHTHTLREIGFPSSGYSYYSVPCEPCLRHAREWKVSLDRQSAAPLLAHTGSELLRLDLDRKLGWETVPGNNYSVETISDKVVLTGRGAGHGVGLCQFGATGYARKGWSFERILSYYFPGTTIANLSH
jgi:stage II sporulation SpoD-like protein